LISGKIARLIFVNAFILSGGDSADMQDAPVARQVPQPLALFTTPVSTKDFQNLTLPISVFLCK
jgi:hypothetical protein